MLDAMHRVVALLIKELLSALKDPRTRIILFAPPVIQSLLLGYAATFDLTDVPYAALDADHSAASEDLLRRFDGARIFHRVADPGNSNQIRDCIDERRALVAIQIPSDFERRLQLGLPAEVQVIADGRNSNTAAIAIGYVGEIVENFNADWRSAHGLRTPPVRAILRAWHNPNLESRWHMIPSLIATLTMLETIIVTAIAVAREREQGTMDQLLVTPLRPVEIIAGKALAAMIIGTTQATSVLLVAQFWFRIPFAGSLLTLYAGLTLFLLAAVGLGILVSLFATTMQQAWLNSFMLIVPFTMLSGLATPISAMPKALQYFSLVNPLRYALDVAQRVYLEGAGFRLLTYDLWPMAIIALVTLTVSSWTFRRWVA